MHNVSAFFFTLENLCIFGALASISGSRTVYVGLSQNTLQFVCSW